jgi:hypothetical protein
MKSIKRNASMVVGLTGLYAEYVMGLLHSGNCSRVRVRFLRGLSKLLKRNDI